MIQETPILDSREKHQNTKFRTKTQKMILKIRFHY